MQCAHAKQKQVGYGVEQAQSRQEGPLTAADVLVGQRLAKALRRRRHRAAQQQLELVEEGLSEQAALLLGAQPRRG